MNKVIVSFAQGKLFANMLSVAIPRFYKYANKHGYDLIIPTLHNVKSWCLDNNLDYNRPASWLKVPIIKHLLNTYDLVQWIDCDVIINKFDKDINEEFITNTCIQSLVCHHDLYEGVVPNCGIWSLKKEAVPLLENIWNQTDFINHKWWEQGANIHLMKSYSDVYHSCHILPYEFNVHKNDVRFSEKDWESCGIMLHATTWDNRLEKMKEWDRRTSYELD